tara:strand:- start:27817 stop:28536 length:720 start_codon:yes stop_codon:yes gene_type:complete
MRLLVVSDLHFTLPQLDWLMKVADRYDAVIIAGDLLDIAGTLPLGNQILIISKYLERISQKRSLLVCSGNHDGDSVNLQNEYIATWLTQVRGDRLYVDGQSLEIGTQRMTILPWWDGPETRQKMEEFLERESRCVRGPWAWLHHAPPNGSPISWTGKKDAGDPNLNRLIAQYRPTYVFCGHIHLSPFRSGGSWYDRLGDTWVFNPGKQIGEIPTYIIIDLTENRATWVSMDDTDSISLA